MTEDRIDQLAAETGIIYGVKAAKEQRTLSHDGIAAVAEQALADFAAYGSDTERAAARIHAHAWYTGFARGYHHGVAAMSRPAAEQTRLREGEGVVLPFRRDR